MIFIDASVFLAKDNLSDVHHQKALAILEDVEKDKYGSALTSDYIFNEVVGVTCRKKSKEKAIELGRKILHSTSLLNLLF